jgi:hypothetical protein
VVPGEVVVLIVVLCDRKIDREGGEGHSVKKQWQRAAKASNIPRVTGEDPDMNGKSARLGL